ncbi:alkaline phosphatase family protein [Sphingomonas sp.]|jgi:predicted AlkP superfamily pyrophosphatase or phosphodiesterase|uniref:alkaline phosphatase family protein n=1 Tax=Sphingomonas sp. TaxID=28214 RepID=UPI002E30A836|nr:alkaline phosphatase family protein [Sphingomonas sp.]HEX4693210.1 alkaline phosphatase family protein [Sphingomonas sp.]
MRFLSFLPLALLFASPGTAQDTAPSARAPKPKLVVVISIDQFSADLFAQYRNRFTGGFARLLDGAVFPSGYQSHSATETCPGHSTIMTGDRPARTGIVANEWYDFAGARPGEVYCMEDERQGTYKDYVASDLHLRVPTLGERMKDADPAVRTVSVAGKDRAAVLMGGHKIDELWFWRDGKGFISYAGRAVPASVARANSVAWSAIDKPGAAFAEPAWCKTIDRPILANGRTVGAGRFERAAKAEPAWKASPVFDSAIFDLATSMVRDMRLGRGRSTDILTIGASATDYVGHTFGTEGSEMCIQLANLDRTLGKFFAMLDATGVDYVVALTADHGGNDIPERERERGVPGAARVATALLPRVVGTAIAGDFGLKGQLLYGVVNGDIWIDPALSPADRTRVRDEAARRYRASPQVAAVFTHDELVAAPLPAGPPETWSLIQRARASFVPERSGDLLVFLKPRITAITVKNDPTAAIATHGSIWDYDRRVPILFWRRGMKGFEQPLSVETVDIAPTLAGLLGFPLAPGAVDGRCLDLDNGPGSTCR